LRFFRTVIFGNSLLPSGTTSYGRVVFLYDTSRSFVITEMDGIVTVKCGVQDIGGGQASSLASISAEILGVSIWS
jgi:CO/xanthine dehydrogenase Mo-binding subunit